MAIAKETVDREEFIKYRKNRKEIDIRVNDDKRKRLEEKMENSKDCWITLKKFGDNDDTEIPTEIVKDGKTIRKHHQLVELANDHFIKKVEDKQKD